ARVLVVAGAGARRVVGGDEQLELPAVEDAGKLLAFVLVSGGERRPQSAQRTSGACSTSAIAATISFGSRSRGSSSESATLRRSASWLISIAPMRAPRRSASSIT